MRLYIYANHYNENSGGNIVLHRLCHIINSFSNHQAYLVPWRKTSSNKKLKVIKERIKIMIFQHKFVTNHLWNTPVYNKWKIPADGIAIYPEITSGNPLNANNVVRWLLHQPGYFTKKINYNDKELYFKFNSAIHDFSYINSYTSKNHLKVIYYPIDIYKEDNSITKDIDVCYLIRKGHYKTVVHDNHAVCIDGLSHTDTANTFKRAKRFICYDDYTAYSIFAILCGCESIVVPDKKVSIEEWYPDTKDRYGIAYGFSDEQLEWAKQTKSKVKPRIEKEHELVVQRVQYCLSEIEDYFHMMQ